MDGGGKENAVAKKSSFPFSCLFVHREGGEVRAEKTVFPLLQGGGGGEIAALLLIALAIETAEI